MSGSENGSQASDYLYLTSNGYPIYLGFFTIQIAAMIMAIAIIAINILLITAILKSYRLRDRKGLLAMFLPVLYAGVGVLFIWHGLAQLLNLQNEAECMLRLGTVHSLQTWLTYSLLILVADR